MATKRGAPEDENSNPKRSKGEANRSKEDQEMTAALLLTNFSSPRITAQQVFGLVEATIGIGTVLRVVLSPGVNLSARARIYLHEHRFAWSALPALRDYNGWGSTISIVPLFAVDDWDVSDQDIVYPPQIVVQQGNVGAANVGAANVGAANVGAANVVLDNQAEEEDGDDMDPIADGEHDDSAGNDRPSTPDSGNAAQATS